MATLVLRRWVFPHERIGPNYVGQPALSFNSTFSSLGNSNGANPFLFRDNQFTADINLSYTKGSMRPSMGSPTITSISTTFSRPVGPVSTPRVAFSLPGGLTVSTASGSPTQNPNAYTALADFLLGLPNNGPAPQSQSQVRSPIPTHSVGRNWLDTPRINGPSLKS